MKTPKRPDLERSGVWAPSNWWLALVATIFAVTLAASASAALATSRSAATAASPAATDAPKAYVGLFKDNAVAAIDTSTNQVIGTIPVPAGPHGLVVTPDGSKVFVSSDSDSTVSAIDTRNDRVMDTIEVGQTPHGLAISPDGRLVLVSGFGSNQAEVIDTASDKVLGQIPVGQPHNGAIGPDNRTAYVGSQQQGATALVQLDLATMTQTGLIPLQNTPRAMNFSPDGRWLYFTVAGKDAVQVLNTATNQLVNPIPVGASPHVPLFTPDGQLALVVSQGPSELDLVDPSTATMVGSVPVGAAPHWVATSSDGRLAYVTGESANTVTVVDVANRQALATIPVGNAPRKIAVQPGAVMAMSDSNPAMGESGASMSHMDMSAAPRAAQSGTTAGATVNDRGTMDVRGMTTVDVEADDNYFEPTFLRGDPGQTIALEIESEASDLHNISIPALGVDENIAPHGKVRVQVTFPQAGSTQFFCKIHEALGMRGALLTGDATP
ncbi:MAG: cupredoxin domain-containing protein [Chloroflexi bacterium]|nr:cupredoxin domain-containing protein [Chloroflexota bacterium]